MKNFKPGDFVWFYYNGYNRYKKIHKIVSKGTQVFALFEEHECKKKIFEIPIEELFKNKKEYFENLTKN